ncbi:MAG TPA: hypothetical protein VGL05_20605 [Kribbella sp.]
MRAICDGGWGVCLRWKADAAGLAWVRLRPGPNHMPKTASAVGGSSG